MDEYKQRAARAFKAVGRAVKALNVPFMQLRCYVSIANAIEVQLEHAQPCKEALQHLGEALLALARVDGMTEEHVFRKALDQFAGQLGPKRPGR